MSTCNRLDLQTLGCQPIIMPKNLLDHWTADLISYQQRSDYMLGHYVTSTSSVGKSLH